MPVPEDGDVVLPGDLRALGVADRQTADLDHVEERSCDPQRGAALDAALDAALRPLFEPAVEPEVDEVFDDHRLHVRPLHRRHQRVVTSRQARGHRGQGLLACVGALARERFDDAVAEFVDAPLTEPTCGRKAGRVDARRQQLRRRLREHEDDRPQRQQPALDDRRTLLDRRRAQPQRARHDDRRRRSRPNRSRAGAAAGRCSDR